MRNRFGIRCGLSAATLIALGIAPSTTVAKVVWAADFEGLTDQFGGGLAQNAPDGIVDIRDVNFNGDDKPDGRFVGAAGTNTGNIIDFVGPDGSMTKVVQLIVNDSRNAVIGDGDDTDLRFRIENVPNGDSAPPRSGFLPFSVDDQTTGNGGDNFNFTKFRVSYYQNTLSTGQSNVFGRGVAVRRGGTTATQAGSNGANLVNFGLNTQVGVGGQEGLANPALNEINRTLNFGYGAGRAPGEPAENGNDAFGHPDPIGVTLAATTVDKNGNGLNTLPAPFYMQNETQSGLPFFANDAPDVVGQWRDFGVFDPATPANNNTGGWVRVDLLIDADVDRTPNTGLPRGNQPTSEPVENTLTMTVTHLASGETVTETQRIWSDDVLLRATDTFFGVQFAHGVDLPGTSTLYDDIKIEAILYGDLNFDDTVDSLDIDALYASGGGAVNSVDRKINDLNYDGFVSLTPFGGGDIDELVRVVLGADFGDVDLNGVIDASDRAVVQSNQGQSGLGWAGGDLNGDGVTNGADLAFFGPDLAGDYNGDGEVNAADYTVWRDMQGLSVTPGALADGNGDGTVNASDYTFWAARYGNSSASLATAVPEPSGVAIALGAILLGAVRRQRCEEGR